MKFYDIDSIFTEGKYVGLTLAEVFEKDPKYIRFCEENLDDFYISPRVLKELKTISRDNAIMNNNLDEMSDDEIAAFLNEMNEDDIFNEEGIIGGDDNFDEDDDVKFEDIDELDLENEFGDSFGDDDDFSSDGFEDPEW